MLKNNFFVGTINTVNDNNRLNNVLFNNFKKNSLIVLSFSNELKH